jgi:5-methyltetrahydrofolate--homocysteine methyltransferase
MDEILTRINTCILQGNQIGTETAVEDALKQGLLAENILYDAMVPAMDAVGELYEQGEYYIPEMLMAAQAMHTGLARIKPKLAEKGVKPLGKIAIGSVRGDLHDIGKNLVAMMLEGAGFQIMDLGTDAGPEKFIDAIKSGAQIIGLSALLTTTMPEMKFIIDQLKEANLRNHVKIMIGGAPVKKAYADQIGADGFASNASEAVALARNLIQG